MYIIVWHDFVSFVCITPKQEMMDTLYRSGLSFREYLAISYGYHLPVYSLEDILKHKVDFPYAEVRPILLFKEYLQHGYYPFFQEKGYLLRLQSSIKQTLENDIPTFANMNIATALKLKKLLYIIAKSVPFKPNFTKLATLLDMNRNTVSDLMCYLEKAGIINQLRAEAEGVRLLGKVDKVYLNNTNLAYALSDNTPDIGNYFLSLPRRFGKSLLISTLETYFQGKRELFEG